MDEKRTRCRIDKVVTESHHFLAFEGNVGSSVQDGNALVRLLEVGMLYTGAGRLEAALECDVLGLDTRFSGGEGDGNFVEGCSTKRGRLGGTLSVGLNRMFVLDSWYESTKEYETNLV